MSKVNKEKTIEEEGKDLNPGLGTVDLGADQRGEGGGEHTFVNPVVITKDEKGYPVPAKPLDDSIESVENGTLEFDKDRRYRKV